MSTGEPTTPPTGPRPGAEEPTTPSAPPARAEWPAQAADLVVDVVDTIRDKTTAPVLTVARGLVYGTAIVFLAITAAVLVVITLVRIVDVAVPGEVWSAYLVLGTLFLAAGLVLWATRRPRAAD